MVNKTILVPVIAFIITNVVAYLISNDPDKKSKPINFILPGALVSVAAFIAMKHKDNSEPMMEGNYFD